MEEFINIEMVFVKANDFGKSYVFSPPEMANVCLPDSQITFDWTAKNGDTVDVEMPLWLARKEGLYDE